MTFANLLLRALASLPAALTALAAALADLVVPRTCAGCGAAGPIHGRRANPVGVSRSDTAWWFPRPASSPLCARCSGAFQAAHPSPVWPKPPPAGLPPVHTAAVYDGLVRAALVSHKEHGRLSLAQPLGRALGAAAFAAVSSAAAGQPRARGPVLIVPVPSSWSSRRRRGHDPVARMARVAAGVLTE
jgi:predicted amidophosphoribosyltransferase